MTVIASLIFCDTCGHLLPQSTGNPNHVFTCNCCGAQTQDDLFKPQRTISKPEDFPSPLRQKLSNVQVVERHKLQTEATIQQECSECGRQNVRYSAVQLRSADEGSTIFYTCDCGHKWTENN